MSNRLESLATAFLLVFAVTAQAALLDRGGGLIYDPDRDITWLADANYARTQYGTSGGVLGDSDGSMNWLAAMDWASNLRYYDGVRNVTYDDWRLPTSLNSDGTGPCSNYDCTGSEMGHLFYTEGGLSAGQSMLESVQLAESFSNIQAGLNGLYWSGTQYDASISTIAWVFVPGFGQQGALNTDFEFFAWPVRPGDVAAAVPEPETYGLMLAGLVVVGCAARRRHA